MNNKSTPPLWFTLGASALIVILSFPVLLLKVYTAVWCWGLLAMPAGAPELPLGVAFGAFFVYALFRLGKSASDNSEKGTFEMLANGLGVLLVQSVGCLFLLVTAFLWSLWLY